MYELKESPILQTSISKILPLAVVFSFYIFSYGANLPGGGFQAGVILGTSIVVVEVGFGRRLFEDLFYKRLELAGVCILIGSLLYGYVTTGFFMGGLYHFTTGTFLLSNVYYWILNLSIYLEVAASILLIFRNFVEWVE